MMSIADKLTTVAENVQKVYDKGTVNGYAKGLEQQQNIIDGYLADFGEIASIVNDNGITYIEDNTPTSEYAEQIANRCAMDFSMGLYAGEENGTNKSYNEFWDNYQNNGKRTNYQYAFSGYGWTVNTFKPKYNIEPQHANGIFLYCGVTGDLGQLLQDKDLILDFSRCTNSDQMFLGSYFTELPVLDFRKVDTTSYMTFASCIGLKKIEMIMLNNVGDQVFSNTFSNCNALADITFSGVIGQSLNMKWSPLNKTSIINIIGCLSGNATGKTLTLNNAAKEASFTTGEWAVLTATKTNWTISLL